MQILIKVGNLQFLIQPHYLVPRTMLDTTWIRVIHKMVHRLSHSCSQDAPTAVFQGVNGTEFGMVKSQTIQVQVSPMYANAERNKARAAFFDPNNKGYSAFVLVTEAVVRVRIKMAARLQSQYWRQTAYQLDGKAQTLMFDLNRWIKQ